MVRIFRRGWLPFFLLLLGLPAGVGAKEPAIVLTAFGTTTAAFDTYRHLEEKVRERFPGQEIRWAFTSLKVRRKLAQEQGKNLQNLPQVLAELKSAGYRRVVVQSLHVVPGEEWQEVVRESRQVPGLQVAVGQPLLSGAIDAALVLEALARTFPADLTKTAVILVGHGSPDPQGEQAYLSFEKLLRGRSPDQNVFLGLIDGKPGRDEVLTEVKRRGVTSVRLVPFLLVAGEHVNTDILGDGPESWKSRLQALGVSQIEGVRRGLGHNPDIITIYLDHLQAAARALNN
jgi:sirohydrochlorin cobaltochelatase